MHGRKIPHTITHTHTHIHQHTQARNICLYRRLDAITLTTMLAHNKTPHPLQLRLRPRPEAPLSPPPLPFRLLIIMMMPSLNALREAHAGGAEQSNECCERREQKSPIQPHSRPSNSSALFSWERERGGETTWALNGCQAQLSILLLVLLLLPLSRGQPLRPPCGPVTFSFSHHQLHRQRHRHCKCNWQLPARHSTTTASSSSTSSSNRRQRHQQHSPRPIAPTWSLTQRMPSPQYDCC